MAVSAQYIKQKTGYFELEDVRHLTIAGKSVTLLAVDGVAILQCTNLSTLTLRKADIKQLDGIEVLQSLEKLDLSENKISNLGPLSKLSNLQELHLANNAITDVKQLEFLRGLPRLSVVSFAPGRGNTIALADRHIPVLIDMLPSLTVIDGNFVSTIKISKSITSTIAAKSAAQATEDATVPLSFPAMAPIVTGSATFKELPDVAASLSQSAKSISAADSCLARLSADARHILTDS